MHRATKIVKSQMSGHCRFINELDSDLYLVSLYPEWKGQENHDCTYPDPDPVRFLAVDHGVIRDASWDEIRLAFHPSALRRLREIQSLNSHRSSQAIFEKYHCQREHHRSNTAMWADNEREHEVYADFDAWVNNGLPTGISSDAEFYRLQKISFGSVIYDIA